MRARPTAAALLACVAVAGGCTSDDVVADRLGVAACRQAASGIQDPASRQGADQACQFIRTGNGRDVSRAAKRTARRRCLNATQQIVDPIARRAIEAFCPKV
ncbi:MAG TPA: hypothetical protein VK304_07190 [Thermoleophilaceae bacterium]|nr:hypothetical protein [Thermoleophilaceae bacterium]